MRGQCMAVLKPLGVTRSYQCPAPAVLGGVYCPLHMVTEGRIKERARRHREFLKYIKERR